MVTPGRILVLVSYLLMCLGVNMYIYIYVCVCKISYVLYLYKNMCVCVQSIHGWIIFVATVVTTSVAMQHQYTDAFLRA